MFKKTSQSAIDSGEVSTARLETLTDGIFAIAMTLLVLDVHVPDILTTASAHELFVLLSGAWPNIASFIVSFIILGMFWVGHHTEFRYIKKVDHTLIWLNIFYLLFVSLLPFSAALIGRYPTNETAIIIYGLHLILLVLVHFFLWRHASHHRNLVVENLDPRINTLANRLAAFAIILYVIAILLSFWNRYASLVIYGLVPVPYIFGWIYYLA